MTDHVWEEESYGLWRCARCAMRVSCDTKPWRQEGGKELFAAWHGGLTSVDGASADCDLELVREVMES